MRAYVCGRFQVSPIGRLMTWDFIQTVMDLWRADICACRTERAARPLIEAAGDEFSFMRSRMPMFPAKVGL